MITASEIYEQGFASSEHKDDGIIYVEFSKFLPSGIEIQVTHEIDKESNIVGLCYVELGIEMSYRIVNTVQTIEDIRELERLLTGTEKFIREKEKKQLNLF